MNELARNHHVPPVDVAREDWKSAPAACSNAGRAERTEGNMEIPKKFGKLNCSRGQGQQTAMGPDPSLQSKGPESQPTDNGGPSRQRNRQLLRTDEVAAKARADDGAPARDIARRRRWAP